MNNIEYREKALELLANDIATEDLGIYPVRVTRGDKVTKRTEWQEGWNACIMAQADKAVKAARYIKNLPDEIKDYILKDVITIAIDEDEIIMWINCNDLFYWACADMQEFELSDLPDLNQAYLDSPKDGNILWVCRQRKMRPQQPFYKYIIDDKELFDACGDERDE